MQHEPDHDNGLLWLTFWEVVELWLILWLGWEHRGVSAVAQPQQLRAREAHGQSRVAGVQLSRALCSALQNLLNQRLDCASLRLCLKVLASSSEFAHSAGRARRQRTAASLAGCVGPDEEAALSVAPELTQVPGLQGLHSCLHSAPGRQILGQPEVQQP